MLRQTWSRPFDIQTEEKNNMLMTLGNNNFSYQKSNTCSIFSVRDIQSNDPILCATYAMF